MLSSHANPTHRMPNTHITLPDLLAIMHICSLEILCITVWLCLIWDVNTFSNENAWSFKQPLKLVHNSRHLCSRIFSTCYEFCSMHHNYQTLCNNIRTRDLASIPRDRSKHRGSMGRIERYPEGISTWALQMNCPNKISEWDLQMKYPNEISTGDIQLRSRN